MTTQERRVVRGKLIEAAFIREYLTDEPKHYDLDGSGIYTEEWRSKKDRTKIIIEWDKKNE